MNTYVKYKNINIHLKSGKLFSRFFDDLCILGSEYLDIDKRKIRENQMRMNKKTTTTKNTVIFNKYFPDYDKFTEKITGNYNLVYLLKCNLNSSQP